MTEKLLDDGKPVDEIAAARVRRKAEQGEDLNEDDVAAIARTLSPIQTKAQWDECIAQLSKEEVGELAWAWRKRVLRLKEASEIWTGSPRDFTVYLDGQRTALDVALYRLARECEKNGTVDMTRLELRPVRREC